MSYLFLYMFRCFRLVTSLLLSFSLFLPPVRAQILPAAVSPSPQREVRAVWLTTLYGLDWPKTKVRDGRSREVQKQELCHILDLYQRLGINTVLFQTRVRSTVLYPSSIEPWDESLTGTIGKSPGYDPLKLIVEECHRRNMELHAWVVVFPICSVSQAAGLGKRALPRVHPELCNRCGDKWMMDPGVPQTADYVASICKEIVANYEVDGIHLDYVRYPEKGIPWNDSRTYRKYGQGKPLAQWRRDNVTHVVRSIHKAIKEVRPWVKLSCSPVGKYADLPRQSSYGWNARDAVSQDVKCWLRENIMDWIFPMMYFDGQHFYPFAQDWQEGAYGHTVVPGLGIYFLHPREKDWPLPVVTRQISHVRSLGMGGVAFYRSRFLTDNSKGLYDWLGDFRRTSSVLTPPMVWQDSVAPDAPVVKMERKGHALSFHWNSVSDNMSSVPVCYNVYRLPERGCALSADSRSPDVDMDGDLSENGPVSDGQALYIYDRLSSSRGMKLPEGSVLLAQKLKENTYTYTPALPALLYAPYAVTSVDAFGNESLLYVGRNKVELEKCKFTLLRKQAMPTAEDRRP